MLFPTIPTTPAGSNQGIATVRLNSTGLSVAYCQNLLNARIPVPVLWVDGIFGPKTDQKVRQYQAMKLLAVDGVVGPMTWASLEAGPPPIKRRPQQTEVVVPASGGF